MDQQTGVISKAEADKLLDDIRSIMKKRMVPFHEALDFYIRGKYEAANKSRT